MSFVLTKVNSYGGNSLTDYKKIAQDFCLEYYTLYDDDCTKLRKMYHSEALFLYLDNEITGFSNWLQILRNNSYYKFIHHNMHVGSMPINESNILMTITGTITLNNNSKENTFTETILLEKDKNNNFCICATIFKVTN